MIGVVHRCRNFLFFLGVLGVLLLQSNKPGYAQYVVNKIQLRNEEQVKTQKSIILRELSFQEGDTLWAVHWDSLIQWNESRIFNLQLFNKVQIALDTLNGIANFDIHVTERLPIWIDPKFTLGDRNFNVWAKEHHFDFKRVNVGFRLSYLNLAGRRIQSSITLLRGYTNRYGLELLVPFVDASKKHGFGWSIFYTSNKEVAVNTRDNKLFFHTDFAHTQYEEWTSDLHYVYRPAYAWQYKIGVKYLHHKIDDEVLQLNPKYLGEGRSRLNLLQPYMRLEFNGVDNWNYPLKGHRFIVQAKWSPSLESNYNYAAVHFQYDFYRKIGPKLFFATDIKSKWTYQNQYTYLNNRNLGYDNDYVRGYEYYVIDGHFMAFARFDLKYELWNKQLALPVRYLESIPFRLYPKIFADIGYSENRWNPSTLNHRCLYSFGLGLDIVTLYDIKIRIELAYNHLNKYDVYIHRQGN